MRGQKAFPPLKTRFIVNPRSGKALRRLADIRAFAAAHGAEVVMTERSRHATDLARRALEARCELIVAVGGDGTMNEIASALVDTPATLGLVPCGSGDGLGRHLGIHGSLKHVFEVLVHGRPQMIDSGLADGHPFFTAAGLGFEAEIAQRFNQLKRRGFFRYLTTSATAFTSWTPEEVTVVHDGQRQRVRAFTLVVGNSDQYGNNARIAPDARADDGLLDLCAVPPITPWNAAPLAVRLFSGTVDRVRGVWRRRGTQFFVERSRPGPIHTDGEVHEAGATIEFSVRPGSLRIMAPANRRESTRMTRASIH